MHLGSEGQGLCLLYLLLLSKDDTWIQAWVFALLAVYMSQCWLLVFLLQDTPTCTSACCETPPCTAFHTTRRVTTPSCSSAGRTSFTLRLVRWTGTTWSNMTAKLVTCRWGLIFAAILKLLLHTLFKWKVFSIYTEIPIIIQNSCLASEALWNIEWTKLWNEILK